MRKKTLSVPFIRCLLMWREAEPEEFCQNGRWRRRHDTRRWSICQPHLTHRATHTHTYTHTLQFFLIASIIQKLSTPLQDVQNGHGQCSTPPCVAKCCYLICWCLFVDIMEQRAHWPHAALLNAAACAQLRVANELCVRMSTAPFCGWRCTLCFL